MDLEDEIVVTSPQDLLCIMACQLTEAAEAMGPKRRFRRYLSLYEEARACLETAVAAQLGAGTEGGENTYACGFDLSGGYSEGEECKKK